MKTLLIDTTSSHCYVAIISDDKVYNATIYHCHTAHSEKLCGAVAEVFESAQMTFEDMDCYAVGIGTGSFTGIRIGVSTVMGYCRAVPKPLIALPTLLMLSVDGRCDRVIQDSGNGYYYCRYQGIDQLENAQLIAYEDDRAQGAHQFDNNKDYLNSLATTAKLLYDNKKFADRLEPLYIRKSQAEINYDNKNN